MYHPGTIRLCCATGPHVSRPESSWLFVQRSVYWPLSSSTAYGADDELAPIPWLTSRLRQLGRRIRLLVRDPGTSTHRLETTLSRDRGQPPSGRWFRSARQRRGKTPGERAEQRFSEGVARISPRVDPADQGMVFVLEQASNYSMMPHAVRRSAMFCGLAQPMERCGVSGDTSAFGGAGTISRGEE
jgi:hypothetical protein